MTTTIATNKNVKGFTNEEKAAMKERTLELHMGKGEGEKAVLTKIAQMPEPDRTMATRLHEIITSSVPTLSPKTWYGMPAYANKDGKVICFFQSAHKFKSRYATLGFSDSAHLDEGSMWPTSFAISKLSTAEETKIKALVKKAMS